MPVLESSNLDFQKIGTRTYQYTSSTLSEENLTIVIDENWWQNMIGTFKSPYLFYDLLMLLPYVLIGVGGVVLILIIRRVRKRKGHKSQE